jgi:hypothetical protein
MVAEPDPAYCHVVVDPSSDRFHHCTRHQQAVPIGSPSCQSPALGRIKPIAASILPATRPVRQLTPLVPMMTGNSLPVDHRTCRRPRA